MNQYQYSIVVALQLTWADTMNDMVLLSTFTPINTQVQTPDIQKFQWDAYKVRNVHIRHRLLKEMHIARGKHNCASLAAKH